MAAFIFLHGRDGGLASNSEFLYFHFDSFFFILRIEKDVFFFNEIKFIKRKIVGEAIFRWLDIARLFC